MDLCIFILQVVEMATVRKWRISSVRNSPLKPARKNSKNPSNKYVRRCSLKSNREYFFSFRLGWITCVILKSPSSRRARVQKISLAWHSFPISNDSIWKHLDEDHVALFKRRAYDIAVSTGCKVSLNGKPIPVSLSPSPWIQLVSI